MVVILVLFNCRGRYKPIRGAALADFMTHQTFQINLFDFQADSGASFNTFHFIIWPNITPLSIPTPIFTSFSHFTSDASCHAVKHSRKWKKVSHRPHIL